MDTRNVIGQIIVAVEQSPLQTPGGQVVTVDRIELANGVSLLPSAYETEDGGPVGDICALALPKNPGQDSGVLATAEGLAPAYSARAADRLLASRKGHGGGECTRRVLRRADLRAIIEAAYNAGMDTGRCMKPADTNPR